MYRTLLGAVSAIGLALFATSASAGTIFGSKLTHEPTPAETCKDIGPAHMCSWVMTIAQGFAGHEAAPKNGTIVKLRLRSCSAGSFVFQIIRRSGATQAAAVRTGPAINYKGNATNCSGGLAIETFNVNVPVLTGQYLGVIATKVGFIYNASGDGSILFDPLLVDGGGLKTAGNLDGDGMLLLQAEYSN